MVPMATSTGTSLSLSAPAKVNLTLCIGSRRPDGFHDLESVFQAVGVCDTVTLDGLDGGVIEVTTSQPGLPCDERNTAFRAAALLRDRHAPGRGVRIHLQKRIPAEAGLGGGSSDAAAVLRGLVALWGLDVPHQEMVALAAAVGSDVPFFLAGGCALVRGRGEVVRPLPWSAPGWFLLVRPAFGVSTARAYRDLAGLRAGTSPPDCSPVAGALCRALETGDAPALAGALANDLEAPVIAAHPEIGRLKQELLDTGALGALMSGSGSVVFGVFAGEAEARAGAAQMAGRWPWVAVARPVGPVGAGEW